MDYVYKINTCHRYMKILSSVAKAARCDSELKVKLRDAMLEDLDSSECDGFGVAGTFESINTELGDFIYIMEAILGSLPAPTLNEVAEKIGTGGAQNETKEEKVG